MKAWSVAEKPPRGSSVSATIPGRTAPTPPPARTGPRRRPLPAFPRADRSAGRLTRDRAGHFGAFVYLGQPFPADLQFIQSISDQVRLARSNRIIPDASAQSAANSPVSFQRTTSLGSRMCATFHRFQAGFAPPIGFWGGEADQRLIAAGLDQFSPRLRISSHCAPVR